MPNLSNLYNISSKGNLRGKAKAGFLRPTICQHFSGKCNFEEIVLNIDPTTTPNFTRSTKFTGHEGEDIIKVNDTMGVTPSNKSARWGCNGTPTGAGSYTDGAQNTVDILAVCEESPIAASVCDRFGDENWYLPAINQLQTLYNNRSDINSVADSDFVSTYYWSSTEDRSYYAYSVNFDDGSSSDYHKFNPSYVRCVRSF